MAKKSNVSSPVSKQGTINEKRRVNRQTFTVEAVVLGVAVFLAFAVASAYCADHPRASLFEGLAAGMQEFLKNPAFLFPLRGSNLGAAFGFTALVELFVFLGYQRSASSLHHDINTIKGSTTWADLGDLVSRYADVVGKGDYRSAPTNVMFSQNLYVSLNTKKHFKSLNTLILGATGSGKSRYYLKPNLLQMNASYVVTDPKGEILAATGEMLRRNGYEVKVFDIVDLGRCDSYNPLKYCKRESDIKKVVQAFIKNTDSTGGKGGGSKDPFWDDSMNAFMCACIAFLVTCPEGSSLPYAKIPEVTGGVVYEACFANLCELTRMANRKWTPSSGIEKLQGAELGDGKNNTANASELAAIFENMRIYEAKRQGVEPELMKKPYALREWENFRIAPEKTSTTILMTAAVRLDPFNIEQVKNLTSSDSMNLDEFASKKTALFMIMPATDRTYNFLLAFLYTQLFDQLYFFGEKRVPGSKVLTTADGDFVRWFSKEEVESSPGAVEKKCDAMRSSKIEKREALGKISGTDIDDSWYDIVDADGELVTRKPTREAAESFVSSLRSAVLKHGRSPALPLHVRMLIDEFPNIGEIPEFKEKLATMRGYEISAVVICQTITQLKGMYPDDYEVVDGNCPFTVFLGGDENTNNEYLAKKIGSATMVTHNTSVDGKGVASGSYNVDERQLMKPEEIGRMPYENTLVFVYGEQPVLDKKFDYPAHRNYKQTHDYAADCGHPEAIAFDRSGYESLIADARLVYKVIAPSAVPCVMQLTADVLRSVLRKSTTSEACSSMSLSTTTERFNFEDTSVAAAF